MKFRSFLMLIVLAAFSNISIYGQAKNGQVQGYVKDVQTSEALPFATVVFEGTGTGTVTNDKGFYFFSAPKAGQFKMKVSYVGYKDTVINITIIENKSINQDVNMSAGQMVGEVVVSGQARGQVKAINSQISSLTIKNVVSEQKIRELPDANAAEALSRLPGVSVSREGGEAVAVRIRGTNANTVYVNGMRMEGSLGSVSSSMIGSIELSKAFLPDQDADNLGGSIDFKMREAPSGFKKEVWFSTGYNDFTKSYKMQDLSVMLSNRFFNDKLGVMLGLNFDRKNRGRELLSATYQSIGSSVNSEVLLPDELTSVSLAQTANLNRRYGITMYSDYKLGNGKLYYQGFYSLLNSETSSATNSYSNVAQIDYASNVYKRDDNNLMNGIGGEHSILGAKLDWGLSLSNSRSITPHALYYNATNNSGMSNVNSIDTTTTVEQFIALGTHDINKTYANSMYLSDNKQKSDELATHLDIKIPFKFGAKIEGFIKFGAKMRDINRSYDRNEKDGVFRNDSQNPISKDAVQRLPDYGWTYLPNGWLGHQAFASDANGTGAEFSMINSKTYFTPDFNKVQEVETAVHDKMYSVLFADANDYSNREKLYATYLMTEIHLGKLITFTPGVRYEKNTYETDAKWLEETIRYGNIQSQGSMKDTTNGFHNEHLFPMIHLKIKPLNWVDLRLAYTETVTRPTFDKMSPRYYRDPSFNISKGDVFLRPQYNTNYDVYLSFYGKKLGLFTVGAFYKEMADQVMDYSVRILDPKDYGLGTAYKNKTMEYPVNNPWSGFMKGMEFDWQTHFSYLPKPFNGFVLNANVTFMESETKYPFYSWEKIKLNPFVYPFYKTVGSQTFRRNKIIGMPDMTGNVALGYEAGGFSGRISMYYQSSTITRAQASDLSTDVDKAAITRFDVQLSQKLKKINGISFYMNINNLTNNPDKSVLTYYPGRVVSDERYGASFDIGVRYKF